MRRSLHFSAVVGTLLFAMLVQPFVTSQPVDAVTASDWQAGYIMDDKRFTDSSSMSTSQIQSWLDKRLANCDPNGTKISELSGGRDYNGDGKVTRAEYGRTHGNPAPFTCLNKYYEVPKTSPGSGIPASNYGKSTKPSGSKSAAQLIYDAGKAYNISPKVLLVKLGTESAGPLTSDTWPFKSQYTYAMGAHCPDSGPGGSANCDTNYSGFSLQMREAAKLLRWYLDSMTQSWWTYKRPGGGKDIAINIDTKDLCSSRYGVQNSNCVGWNVPRSCGGTVINIQSKATAALYTYTPYQPNSAALNNMYGTGNGCSSYGNRNFWRVYNDWFGPTTSAITSYLSLCSGQKYLVETSGTRKRLIPDTIASAWRLSEDNFVSNTGCDMPSYSLPMSELVRSRNTGKLYYIHAGIAYYVESQSIADAWGLGPTDSLPQVDGSTLHTYMSNIDTPGLTHIATSDNPAVETYYFLLDGKRYSMSGTASGSSDVLRLISGDTVVARNVLPATLLQSLPSTATLDYHFTVNGELFVFDFGKIRKIESSSMANLLSNETNPPIPLDPSILDIYTNKQTLADTFLRDNIYYLVNQDASLTKTDSSLVLRSMSTNTAPGITRLLTSRLVNNSTGSTTENLLRGNVRLIACGGLQYLVERFIPVKRPLTPYAIMNWSMDGKHFFDDDKGCSYPTYSIALDKTIRSRTTGKVYHVINGNAYYISDLSIAVEYGVANDFATADYPQFDGDSINDNLVVIK